MQITTTDIHQQFAEYFRIPDLRPFAYILSLRMSEGHICLPLDKTSVEKWVEDLPEWYRNEPPDIAKLAKIPLVGNINDPNQPFILHRDRLYFQRYYKYETALITRILKFLDDEASFTAERMEILEQHQSFIQALFPPEDVASLAEHEQPAWQLTAAITAVLHNFTIITGGPGTGKTTTVSRLLAILHRIDPDLKVALVAPTGKAAARLAESLRKTVTDISPGFADFIRSLSPATIHRLLRQKRGTPYFHQNADNPLQYDVVIVDESSMLDVALFAKLIDAIDGNTRLILLGDKDQLASVEAGSFFGDLCSASPELNRFTPERRRFINNFIADRAQHIPAGYQTGQSSHPLFQHTIELQRSRRFSGENGIGRFSKAVLNSDSEILRQFAQQGYDSRVIIDPSYDDSLFQRFISGFSAFIIEPEIGAALRLLGNLRVLCAIKEGDAGLYATNKAIEQYLHDRKWLNTYPEYYENRPLMLTTNNYEQGLFNGDTGIIRRAENGVLMAWFEDADGNLKSVLPGYLTGAETAFAMTIHKSQGSEFGSVLVRLPDKEDIALLTRELLYTAITRARDSVLIQSSLAVLLATASRHVSRSSGIASRFSEDIDG